MVSLVAPRSASEDVSVASLSHAILMSVGVSKGRGAWVGERLMEELRSLALGVVESSESVSRGSASTAGVFCLRES